MTPPTPSVSFLVPSISGPVLGPVTVLAKILARHVPVQVVGPDLGEGVCSMYRDAFPYTVVPTPRIYRIPDYWREMRTLADAVTGDVVIAVKAASTTIPVALRLRRTRGARAIAYLDELDSAAWQGFSPRERWVRRLRHWQHPGDEMYLPRLERMIAQMDDVVSTTRFMRDRFGGRIIHMGVDPAHFYPRETTAVRAEFGIDSTRRWVVFGGVVRPHKGVELILEALALLPAKTAGLLVVGPITEHLASLQSDPRFGPLLRTVGAQPAHRMPEFLSLADAIVLPLRDDLLARSQMPCKVFEAMAMARPIVASRVSDLPHVLERCGWIVPPENAPAIAEALADIFAHPERAAQCGRDARTRLESEFSHVQTETALLDLIGSTPRPAA
jgi:glycosyltransferase involved in cell wall biosynthesis